jgi:hypothetical protein
MHRFIAAFPKILRPHLVHRRRHSRDSHRLAQKSGFFSIAFNKMNFGAQATGIPGNPAPDPRSTQIRARGANGMSCSESAMCRVHNRASVEDATRFIVFCQSNSASTNVSKRFSVSRETGVSFKACALSAARSSAPCPRLLTRF